MSNIKTIRNLRNNHDKSIQHISKELNINWRTAKKYADRTQFPQKKKIKKRGMMYEGKWGDIVSLWLSEDARLTKKKRRTNLAYFNELIAIGFLGSYRTVCTFIQEWRQTHSEEKIEMGFDRLEHPPADSQLDFGLMEVEYQGTFKDVKVLVLSFPYSNAGFAVALPAENQECLLEGMKQLFSQAGGVPKNIRIDNMSTAVKERKTKFKPARLTDDFFKFSIHYGFETQVCNPRSGHEKGHVENKVGYIRYNFFPTAPKMIDFSLLNQELFQKLKQDHQRLHYEKNRSIDDLWKEEKSVLYELPEEEYPVFKEIEVKANKYNEITLDRTRLHVHYARNHAILYAHLMWDRYQILSSNGDILDEGLRPYMEKSRPIPWQLIFNDWKHQLSKIHYSRYWKYLPGRIQHYLIVEDVRLLYKRVMRLRSLLTTHDMASLNEQFYELVAEDQELDEYSVDWTTYDRLTDDHPKGAA